MHIKELSIPCDGTHVHAYGQDLVCQDYYIEDAKFPGIMRGLMFLLWREGYTVVITPNYKVK